MIFSHASTGYVNLHIIDSSLNCWNSWKNIKQWKYTSFAIFTDLEIYSTKHSTFYVSSSNPFPAQHMDSTARHCITHVDPHLMWYITIDPVSSPAQFSRVRSGALHIVIHFCGLLDPAQYSHGCWPPQLVQDPVLCTLHKLLDPDQYSHDSCPQHVDPATRCPQRDHVSANISVCHLVSALTLCSWLPGWHMTCDAC